VPKSDLKKIMEAGIAAPSGCNKQTVSFIAVNDRKLLKELHKVIKPPIGDTAPAMICVLTQKINAYSNRCFHVQDYSAAWKTCCLRASNLDIRVVGLKAT
jgi:nitroreductase